MARLARVVVPGLPHHVTQRGVRSTDIFRDDADREFYIEILRASGERHGLTFLADGVDEIEARRIERGLTTGRPAG